MTTAADSQSNKIVGYDPATHTFTLDTPAGTLFGAAASFEVIEPAANTVGGLLGLDAAIFAQIGQKLRTIANDSNLQTAQGSPGSSVTWSRRPTKPPVASRRITTPPRTN